MAYELASKTIDSVLGVAPEPTTPPLICPRCKKEVQQAYNPGGSPVDLCPPCWPDLGAQWDAINAEAEKPLPETLGIPLQTHQVVPVLAVSGPCQPQTFGSEPLTRTHRGASNA